MERVEKDKLEELSKFLIDLSKKVDLYRKQGGYVDFNINMVNTGITEVPLPLTSGWQEYVSLGGQSFEIRIEFPNNKSLYQAIKEMQRKAS